MSEQRQRAGQAIYRPTARGYGSAAAWARLFIGEALLPGSVVVDATMGNGRDTLFLAGAVGPAGRVYAFDIQPAALKATAALLAEAGLADRAQLIQADHSLLQQHLPGPVDAVMFNLGYLPGGDHSTITTPETTRAALHASLSLLAPGGRASVVVYTGHPGAAAEQEAVENLAGSLSLREFSVIKLSFMNCSPSAPVVILVEKAGRKNESMAAKENN